MDVRWNSRAFKKQAWNQVAEVYQREQVFALTQYYDEVKLQSLLACTSCGEDFIAVAQPCSFDMAEGSRYLDLKVRYVKQRGTRKKMMKLTLISKT